MTSFKNIILREHADLRPDYAVLSPKVRRGWDLSGEGGI